MLCKRHRLNLRTIAASPGYFATTFENGIKLEATSTRRAGLIQFTYPSDVNGTLVVVDLANDLQRSFEGGQLEIDASSSRVTLSGTYLQVRIIGIVLCNDRLSCTLRATERITTPLSPVMILRHPPMLPIRPFFSLELINLSVHLTR